MESLFNSRVINDVTPKLGRGWLSTADSAAAAAENNENIAPTASPPLAGLQLPKSTRRGLFRSPSEPRLLLRKSHSVNSPVVSSSPLHLTSSTNSSKLKAPRLTSLDGKARKRSSESDYSCGNLLRRHKKRRRSPPGNVSGDATTTATSASMKAMFQIGSSDSSSESSSDSCDVMLGSLPPLPAKFRVPPLGLHRSHSSEADIMTALNRMTSDPDLVGDMSRDYALPTCPTRSSGLKGIAPETVSCAHVSLAHMPCWY